MKWLKAFTIGRTILQHLSASGVTIKGRDPAQVEQAIEDAAKTVVQALKKPTGPTQKPAA